MIEPSVKPNEQKFFLLKKKKKKKKIMATFYLVCGALGAISGYFLKPYFETTFQKIQNKVESQESAEDDREISPNKQKIIAQNIEKEKKNENQMPPPAPSSVKQEKKPMSFPKNNFVMDQKQIDLETKRQKEILNKQHQEQQKK